MISTPREVQNLMDRFKMFEAESRIKEAVLGADSDDDECQDLPNPKSSRDKTNAQLAEFTYVEPPFQRRPLPSKLMTPWWRLILGT